MTSVEEQVRRYASFVLDEGSATDLGSEPAGGHARGLLIAVVALFVGVLAVAALLMSTGGETERAPATDEPTPSGPTTATATHGPLELSLWISNAAPGPDEQVKATVTATNVGDRPISIPPLCWQAIAYHRDFDDPVPATAPAGIPSDVQTLFGEDISGLALDHGGVFTTEAADRAEFDYPAVVPCPSAEPRLLQAHESVTTDGYLTLSRAGFEGNVVVRASLSYGDDALPLDPYVHPRDDRGLFDSEALTDSSRMPVTVVQIPVRPPDDSSSSINRADAVVRALQLPEIVEWCRALIAAGPVPRMPTSFYAAKREGIWVVEVRVDESGTGFKVHVTDDGAATVVDLQP